MFMVKITLKRPMHALPGLLYIINTLPKYKPGMYDG